MSPPGNLFSICSPAPSPTIRKPVVRLSRPHTTFTGAQLATAYRLYEFTLGAMNSASSRCKAIIPPRNQRIVWLIPYVPPAGS